MTSRRPDLDVRRSPRAVQREHNRNRHDDRERGTDRRAATPAAVATIDTDGARVLVDRTRVESRRDTRIVPRLEAVAVVVVVERHADTSSEP